MSKKKPFDQLILSPQYRFKNRGFVKKENTGLDTETYQGYVKLIADDEGNYKLVSGLLEILQFLTHKRFRQKFNWFYNIKYDFESIIKYLDKDLLYELYYEKTLTYQRYKILYFDKKYFGITDTSNHRYHFYDMFNFLELSLDNASKKYLNDHKIGIINSSLLNTDINYWHQNEPDIIKYCIYDANLVKRLADYFWNLIYAKLEYFPKCPFSKGKLSEEYFLSKCYIPTIMDIPKSVLEMAYNSYYGGRFELLKRGKFDEVNIYDIKSAYPYQMTKLIDFSQGKWIESRELSDNIGFYHCYVSTMENNFSPFMIRRTIGNLFPNGNFYTYLTSLEIKFIEKNFYNTEINILKGFEFIPFKEIYPYKDEIERLYKWKETEKDEDIKHVVKIILNSLYGKTIQGGSIGRTGKLFNPIYAALITSGTRLKLLEYALKSSENVIAFSTDSLSLKSKINIPKMPKLGDFSFEFSGLGLYIQSDVYTLWNEEKYKHRFRSFKSYKDTISTLFDILGLGQDYDKITLMGILKDLKNDTLYPIETTSPYHLGECLIHTKKKNPEMINIFHKSSKNIDINGDIRRVWDRDFKNGLDAMENNINSYPMKFDIKQRKTRRK